MGGQPLEERARRRQVETVARAEENDAARQEGNMWALQGVAADEKEGDDA